MPGITRCCRGCRAHRTPGIAEIAGKAVKEVAYHLERSRDWVIRLGDGTAESHRRVQHAVDTLWPYTGEMFEADAVDEALVPAGVAVPPASLHAPWLRPRRRHARRGDAAASRPPTGCSAAASAACTASTSATCWPRCSSCSAPIPVPMVTGHPTVGDEVWDWLREVPDPEIPVVSVVDLGIVRDVRWQAPELVVTVTPTYSGCPATAVIALEIENALRARGVEQIRLERRLSPPWTTEWISAAGQQQLQAIWDRRRRDRAGRGGRMPALRLRRHGVHQPFRLDALQGAISLPAPAWSRSTISSASDAR